MQSYHCDCPIANDLNEQMEVPEEAELRFFKRIYVIKEMKGNGIYMGNGKRVVCICQNGVTEAKISNELKLGKMTRTTKDVFKDMFRANKRWLA